MLHSNIIFILHRNLFYKICILSYSKYFCCLFICFCVHLLACFYDHLVALERDNIHSLDFNDPRVQELDNLSNGKFKKLREQIQMEKEGRHLVTIHHDKFQRLISLSMWRPVGRWVGTRKTAKKKVWFFRNIDVFNLRFFPIRQSSNLDSL